MFNPRKMMEMKKIKEQFEQRHPKVFPFLQTVSQSGICEGSIIEINVTRPDGKNFCSNIKVTPEDLEMLQQLKTMR